MQEQVIGEVKRFAIFVARFAVHRVVAEHGWIDAFGYLLEAGRLLGLVRCRIDLLLEEVESCSSRA
jgi:hypothetical protein